MGQIAEVICGPLLKMLEERIINNEMKRKCLLEKKKELIAFIDQARIEKVHKEQELQRAKEKAKVSIPSTSTENQDIKPSSENVDETLVKKLESEKVQDTSIPTKSTEMPGIEKAEIRSETEIAGNISYPLSPENSDITSDESTYDSPEMATGSELEKTEPKSPLISEEKETELSNNNNEGASVDEKKINIEN